MTLTAQRAFKQNRKCFPKDKTTGKLCYEPRMGSIILSRRYGYFIARLFSIKLILTLS